jgi:IclR family acetate operon transcriptional repressor
VTGTNEDGRDRTSVARIFHALELLAEAPRTPSDLAASLGLNRSSALRMLRQLEATGYVARDSATKTYATIGTRFLQLASRTSDHTDLSEIVDPILRDVRMMYGEAALLALPAGHTMVYAAFFPSHQLLSVREGLGAVRPMHCSAVGKAYLSGLTDAALEVELSTMRFEGGTDSAPVDRPSLYRQLVVARKKGYAVEHNETSAGVSCVAAPVWIGDSLIGSIGVTGPTLRLTDDVAATIGEHLRSAAISLRSVAPQDGR